MATLLERGINAARNGHHREAKTFLTEVLKQNSRNEQAWLWLSEVVDTVGEQITCIEQVLSINPDNKVAKLALQKLKAQPARLQPAAPTASVEVVNAQTAVERRPQRLDPAAAALINDTRVNHQTTASLPALPMPELSEYIPNMMQQTPAMAQGMALNQNMLANAAVASGPGQQKARATDDEASALNLDNLPLLPMIIFGTLSVTAFGGLIMIGLLVIFS